jgi:hypothetical protein
VTPSAVWFAIRLTLQPAFHPIVDGATVRHDHHRDDPRRVINALDHAIVTDTNTVMARVAFDRLGPGWAGILGKGFHAAKNARLHLAWETIEVFVDCRKGLNCVVRRHGLQPSFGSEFRERKATLVARISQAAIYLPRVEVVLNRCWGAGDRHTILADDDILSGTPQWFSGWAVVRHIDRAERRRRHTLIVPTHPPARNEPASAIAADILPAG